jgi:hypothetical protein
MQNRGRTEYYDGDVKPNGTSEGRIIATGPVASAGSAADLRAIADRIRQADARVSHYESTCEDARTRLEAAEQRSQALPEYVRGWPLFVVFALGLITIVLEYVPASLFTQIFITADDNLRRVLTWTFTAIGALLAVFLGELLHRLRRPERQHVRDTILVAITIVVTLAYLYIGFRLRLAYTATAGTAVNLTAPIEAFALSSVAAVGILLTVISAYYREGIESFTVGMKVAGLRRELGENEAHLKAHRHDLVRAQSAAGVYPGHAPADEPAPTSG